MEDIDVGFYYKFIKINRTLNIFQTGTNELIHQEVVTEPCMIEDTILELQEQGLLPLSRKSLINMG